MGVISYSIILSGILTAACLDAVDYGWIKLRHSINTSNLYTKYVGTMRLIFLRGLSSKNIRV